MKKFITCLLLLTICGAASVKAATVVTPRATTCCSFNPPTKWVYSHTIPLFVNGICDSHGQVYNKMCIYCGTKLDTEIRYWFEGCGKPSH